MNIASLLAKKGNRVITAEPGESVRQALTLLAAHNIGALLVVDQAGSPVGIASERDIVREAARNERLFAEPVSSIMTKELIIGQPGGSRRPLGPGEQGCPRCAGGTAGGERPRWHLYVRSRRRPGPPASSRPPRPAPLMMPTHSTKIDETKNKSLESADMLFDRKFFRTTGIIIGAIPILYGAVAFLQNTSLGGELIAGIACGVGVIIWVVSYVITRKQ